MVEIVCRSTDLVLIETHDGFYQIDLYNDCSKSKKRYLDELTLIRKLSAKEIALVYKLTEMEQSD